MDSSFLTAALAFAFAVYLYLWVKKRRVENKRFWKYPHSSKKVRIRSCAESTKFWRFLPALPPSSSLCCCLRRLEGGYCPEYFHDSGLHTGNGAVAVAGKSASLWRRCPTDGRQRARRRELNRPFDRVPRRCRDGAVGSGMFAAGCGGGSAHCRRCDDSAGLLLRRQLAGSVCQGRRRNFHENGRRFLPT